MSLWVLERLGKKVSVQFTSEVSIDVVFGPLFADFQLRTADRVEGVLLEVSSKDQGWLITDTKLGDENHVLTAGDLVYFLSDKIIYHLVDRITVGHCLHAACVAKDDRAYVLPAESGSGKSSFTCWLVANGFDYVTDELTILLESGKVSAIPRPMQIKSHGVEAIKPLLKDKAQILQGDFVNAISAEAFNGQHSELNEWQLSGIIFPKYTQGSSFSYEPMPSASVAMQLMGSHVNARNLDSHGFRFMTALAREIPAYKLEYGGFTHLPDQLSKMILE